MDNNSDPLTASDSTPECLRSRHTTRTGVWFSPPNNYANLPYELSRIENKQYIINNNVRSRHEGKNREIALLSPGRERREFLFSPYLLCKLVAIFIVTGKKRACIVKEKTRFLVLGSCPLMRPQSCHGESELVLRIDFSRRGDISLTKTAGTLTKKDGLSVTSRKIQFV